MTKQAISESTAMSFIPRQYKWDYNVFHPLLLVRKMFTIWLNYPAMEDPYILPDCGCPIADQRCSSTIG